MSTQNLKNLTLEAIALSNNVAIQCCGKFYKNIVLAGLATATAHEENLSVYEIDSNNIICTFNGKDIPTSTIDWCWDTFGNIAYNPLTSDKMKRSIPLSNHGYHAECIQELRRSLLVHDEGKSAFSKSIYKLNHSSVQCSNSDEYRALSVSDQLWFAESVYYNMIIVCITECDKLAGVQLQLGKGSDIRLIVWGGFKPMKK